MDELPVLGVSPVSGDCRSLPLSGEPLTHRVFISAKSSLPFPPVLPVLFMSY